jgi:hypothetical protein
LSIWGVLSIDSPSRSSPLRIVHLLTLFIVPLPLATHTCHPSYLGGWEQEDHSLGAVVCTCKPNDSRKHKTGECAGQPENNVQTYLQNNQRKKTGDMARVAGQIWSPEFKL